jgi:aminoglycoside phosphotransferase (APT) family kinase protein
MTAMTADIAHLVPWLEVTTCVPLTGGWTYETYAVNDAWIVQIGRTNYAANTLRHQCKVLPKLAAHLGNKVPAAQLVCDGPTTMLYKKLEGVRCDEAGTGAWPGQLGGLLARLHQIPTKTLGLETCDSSTLRADHRDDCRRLLGIVAPLLGEPDRIKADRLVSEFLDDDKNWHFTPGAIHGDLGPEHVLVSPAGELVGVLDWEEVRTGDPAADFGWWLYANEPVGKQMLSAYGGVPDDRFLARAQHAHAMGPWHEVAHGVEHKDDSIIQSGLAGVRARLG